MIESPSQASLSTLAAPEHLLFSQHGWADTNRTMLKLGRALASPADLVVAPNLGYAQTWGNIEPLVEAVEREASAALDRYPDVPARIVGHSLGGLLWLEVLHRHESWWPRVDRLVLLGSPVGGAEAAAILGSLGIAFARGLRRSRRELAEVVAAGIPSMVVVGDALPGNDGTVTHRSARLEGIRYVAVPGATHASMRSNKLVRGLIRAFFHRTEPPQPPVEVIVERLRAVPGLQGVDPRLCRAAPVFMMFEEGTTIRLWHQLPGVDLVFVADAEGQCLFAGLVRSDHRSDLRRALRQIKEEYAGQLV